MSQPRGPRLLGKYGPFRGIAVELGPVTTIGRGDDNDVVLANPAVSHRHVRIERQQPQGRFVLSDEGSSNGTTVDGFPVREPVVLGDVAVIGIAGVGELIFSAPGTELAAPELPSPPGSSPLEVPGQTTVEEQPGLLAEALARIRASGAQSPDRTVADLDAPVLPTALGGPNARDEREHAPARARRWVLAVDTGEGEQRFRLARGAQVIGRGARAQIRIDHPQLSRRHARIEVGERVSIEDLGSSNRTSIAGRELTGRTELQAGAELSFGDLRARLLVDDG